MSAHMGGVVEAPEAAEAAEAAEATEAGEAAEAAAEAAEPAEAEAEAGEAAEAAAEAAELGFCWLLMPAADRPPHCLTPRLPTRGGRREAYQYEYIYKVYII